MFEKDAKLDAETEQQLVSALSRVLPGVDKEEIRNTLRGYRDMGLTAENFPLHMHALIAKIRSKRK